MSLQYFDKTFAYLVPKDEVEDVLKARPGVCQAPRDGRKRCGERALM
jgi:hypothetical protein